jgi:toxin CptA
VSSKKSVPPLRIEPRLSRQLALLLLCLHGAALAVIGLLQASFWVHAALSAVVLVNFYSTFTTHVLGWGKLAILSLVWGGDGEWTLLSAKGSESVAKLLPSSYVHPRMIILNFRIPETGRRTQLLMQDSLDPNTYRRLLARMRLEANKEDSKNQ